MKLKHREVAKALVNKDMYGFRGFGKAFTKAGFDFEGTEKEWYEFQDSVTAEINLLKISVDKLVAIAKVNHKPMIHAKLVENGLSATSLLGSRIPYEQENFSGYTEVETEVGIIEVPYDKTVYTVRMDSELLSDIIAAKVEMLTDELEKLKAI